MKFECHLKGHQLMSKLYDNFNYLNLTVFDEISNDI
jgi:hypothetical protein